MDVSGYVLAANKAAASLFDLKSNDTLQQYNIYDLLPQDAADSRRAKIAEAIRDVRAVRFEEEIDGRSLVHSIVPVANPWGEVARLAVHTLDLTKLRRTDEDLRREQQRQIFFMESLPGIVYHLYPDNTIRYANRYFRRYFGSPRDKTCREALNCSDLSCEACPPMESMKTDRALEWDWTDAQGRTFHLQCSPMTDSAGERMIMVLGIDITARQKAEDALKQARDKLEERVRQRTEELEQANLKLTNKSVRLVNAMKKADEATRAKSSFLANMSHEIRTPLNAVLGMAELAMSVTDPDRKNHYLGRIMDAGNSLLAIINDILDFSKIEAHKLALEAIDFDIRRTMEATLDLYMLPAGKKGLDLTFSVDDDVPQVLMGDPSRLGQILINLVSNAIKFTETGGVDVRVSLVEGPKDVVPEAPVKLLFSVSDTGVGIAEDKQKDVFESFLQADDSITRKHGGTGLGLTICTLLVELMGGEIGLESEEGKGSTFRFSARLKVGDADKVEADMVRFASRSIPDMPRLKVLLADDNALNRELATTLLTEQGHEVLDVTNGVKALDALKERHFDMVLMDVQMPVMDGISATRAIRDPNSGVLDPDIPIIALTAHALKGDRERFLEAGMNDYISKPITMRGFYDTIARAAAGAPPASSTGASAKPAQTDGSTLFDRQSALDMLGGREALLRRMDEIFIRDVPEDLKQLTESLETHDWDTARRLAHSIKGAARTVGALRTGAIAEQLEYLCKQKDVSTANKELKILECETEYALKYVTKELGDKPETP
jgi:signal transduction histidine kinase/DNA-binding response OmpR family regulator